MKNLYLNNLNPLESEIPPPPKCNDEDLHKPNSHLFRKEDMKETSTEQPESSKKAFSLTDIRNDQNFDKQAGIVHHTPKIEVKRPGKFTFFRTFGPKENWIKAKVVDDGPGDNELLVSNAIQHLVEDYSRPVLLIPCIDRQGRVFIWPLKMAKEGSFPMRWHTSTREAAIHALTNWTQISADKKIKAYSIKTAEGDLSEPVWPDRMDIETLIQDAFADKYIDSLDHPVIQQLRGLV